MSTDMVSAGIAYSRRRTAPHRNVAQFRRERHQYRQRRLLLEHLEDRRLLSMDFGFANAFTSNISEDQWASDTAVDAAGNVYVTGTYSGTIDFDPGAGATTLTALGSGWSGRDVFIAKYTSVGGLVWAKSAGGNNYEQPGGIAVDSQGNVYVVGEFGDNAQFGATITLHTTGHAGFPRDAFVTKLDANGNFLWARAAGGTEPDGAYDVAVDTLGNVYVSGPLNSTTANFPNTANPPNDVPVSTLSAAGGFLWKLDAGGATEWARATGLACTVAADSSGHVYVGGSFTGTRAFGPTAGGGTQSLTSLGGSDAFLAEYDEAGTLLWARSWGGTDNDCASEVVLDTASHLWVLTNFFGTTDLDPSPSGVFSLTSFGNQDGAVSKLTTAGDWMWSQRIAGTVDTDQGTAIAVDAANNVYISSMSRTAGSYPNPDDFDTTITKLYGPTGGTLWSGFMGRSLSDTRVTDLAVDAQLNLFMAGSFTGTSDLDPGTGTATRTTSGGCDIFLAKSGQSSALAAGDIVVTDSGTVDVKLAVVKVNPSSGALTELTSGGNFQNGPHGIAIASDKSMFVTNWTTSNVGQVIRVDPILGVQTVVASGGQLVNPVGIAIAPNGALFVTDVGSTKRIIRIDLTTTPPTQTVVSSGGLFTYPRSLALDANGDLLVVNAGGGKSILRVNPTTGSQTVVSANGNFTGPSWLAIAATGDLFVSDSTYSSGYSGFVIRVSPTSGAQTVVASGPPLYCPNGIAVEASGDLIVGDSCNEPGAVIRVNPTTGAKTVLVNDGLVENAEGVAIVNDPPVAVDDAYTVAEDQTLIANGTTGGWQTLSSMPTPRSALAAAALDGLLYTAGGTPSRSVNTSKAVEAFDPASNTWTSKPPLPTQTTDAAAAVLDGELYVIGGWPSSVPTNQVQIYNPTTDAWRYGTAMPALSACSVATELNGKLYVLTACDGYSGWRKRLDMYDPKSNTWTSKAQAPHEHAGAGTAVIDGKWYVAGGGIWGVPTDYLDVYDPATDSWTTKANLPAARTDVAAGAIGRKLYVAGGSGSGGTPLSSVDVYDPATNTWASGPAIPTPRSDLNGAVIGGSLITAGGIPAGTPPTRVGTCQSLSPTASVLSNDTDPEGDPLTAVPATPAAHGTVTLNPNGTFTYTADANFSGLDSFTYRAFDGQDYSNVATVWITVTAAPTTEIATLGFAFRLGAGSDDSGVALASDVLGNVYVAGLFGGKVDFDQSAVTANLSGDAFIAKYDASGSLVWARSLLGDFGYEGADICVDSKRNVYVTGGFEGNVDFDPGPDKKSLNSGANPAAFVLKLDDVGSFQWAKAFTGGETGGLGIAVDGSGNVYSTGFFLGTVEFDPVAKTTSSRLSSAGSYDAYVSKLDSSGNYAWAKRVGGALSAQWLDNADLGYDIAVDSDGNVYTTGTFRGKDVDFNPDPNVQYPLTSSGPWNEPVYHNDAFVWKLDSGGNFVWAKRLGGPAQGHSIAVDAQRNVYSSGVVYGDSQHIYAADGDSPIQLNGGRTIYVSKLNPDGKFAWVSGFASIPVEPYTVPQVPLGLDSTGRVYVAGQFRGLAVDVDPGVGTAFLSSVGGTDIFLSRLDGQTGDLVSADRMGGTSDDLGFALATGPAGSVYATGSFRGTVYFDPDDTTQSLKSAGGQDAFVSKIEYRSIVPGPEIGLSSGGTDVADGGMLNFGSTPPGVAVRKSLTIKNVGTQKLDLTALSGLPAGFTIEPAFTALSLEPHASASYTVSLQSNETGNYYGTLSFANSDKDENPFHVLIHGQVAPAGAETYFDSDGDSYTVKLSGPGTADIRRATDSSGRGPIQSIRLSGTNATSSLSIAVTKAATGDGKVTIGQIIGDGDLKSLLAAKSDLIGAGFDFTGWVGQVTLGDLKNDAGISTDIRLGGTATQSTKMTLGEVRDSMWIETDATLTSLAARSITGTPSLHAPAIGTLSTTAGPLQIDLDVAGAVKSVSTKGGGASGAWTAASFGTIAVSGGDLAVDLQATATAAALGKTPAVNKLTVSGGGASGSWRAASFGAVSVVGGDFKADLAAIAAAGSQGKTAAVSKLTVSGGDFTGRLHALGNVGTFQISKDKTGVGGSLLDTQVMAAAFGTFAIGGNLTNSMILAGGNLGNDLDVGGTDGNADTFGPGSISKFTVGGQAQNSIIGAGLDPVDEEFRNGNDQIVGGTASKVGSFSITGDADDDCYFRAGTWPKSVKINKLAVHPLTDFRFLDYSPVRILDDGDARFLLSGLWKASTQSGYQKDYRYSEKGQGTDSASWTFHVSPGVYRVSATWPTLASNATNASYTMLDGTNPLGTVTVNQQVSPNDRSDAGTWWEDLGGPYAVSGNTLVVKLTDLASGNVIADAVRIELAYDPWRLPGSGSAPANDNIPDVPVPEANADDFVFVSDGVAISSRELLLKFSEGTSVQDANALLAETGAAIEGTLPEGDLLLLQFPRSDLAAFLTLASQLNADPRVDTAIVEMTGSLQSLPRHNITPNLWDWQLVPVPDGNWGLEAIRAPQMWNLDDFARREQGRVAGTISAGVVDAGFTDNFAVAGSSTHPDLAALQIPSGIAPDDHGTMVAGIIGATHNGVGVEGINPWVDHIYGTTSYVTAKTGGPEYLYGWGRLLGRIGALLKSDATIKAVNNSYGYNWLTTGLDGAGQPAAIDPKTVTFGDLNGDNDNNDTLWRDLNNDGFHTPDEDVTEFASDMNGDGRRDTWADVVQYWGDVYREYIERFAASVRGDFILVSSAGNAGGNYDTVDNSPIANAATQWHSGRFLAVESINWNNTASSFSTLEHAPPEELRGSVSAPGECVRSTEANNGANADDTNGDGLADCIQTAWPPNPPAGWNNWWDGTGAAIAATDQLYATGSGTSFAAPYVTGLIAALMKLDLTLTVPEITELLTGQNYTVETKGGTSPRIDAFAAAIGIDVVKQDPDKTIQRALVDVDDGSLLDGNARFDADDEDNDEVLEERVDTIRNSLNRRGDGVTNMKDFRAFRDATLQSAIEFGRLNASGVSLDGIGSAAAPTHFKKDLNFDGCVGANPVNPPHPTLTTPTACGNAPLETIDARYDFNGSGLIDEGGWLLESGPQGMVSVAPFKIDPDTKCTSVDREHGCLRDIDVMAADGIWTLDREGVSIDALLDDRNSDNVIDYLKSADFHFIIDPDPPGASGAVTILIRSEYPGGAWEKTESITGLFSAKERRIVSVPLFASSAVTIKVTRQGLDQYILYGDGKLNGRLKYGQDVTIRLTTPTASITDVRRLEGGGVAKSWGTGEGEPVGAAYQFTVQLDQSVDREVRIDFQTSDGTATIADNDYLAKTGTLVFAAGETTKTIDVTVLDDSRFEPDETFFVTLTGSEQAFLPSQPGQGTVVNDDLPELSIGDVEVTEGNSGTVAARFPVSLSYAFPVDVTFNYATTSGGTATSGTDYVAVAATRVTIPAGATQTTVNVNVKGDKILEHDESFFVQLTDATNALLVDAEGQGTILDDEPTPNTTGLWQGPAWQKNGMCTYSGTMTLQLNAYPQYTTVVTGQISADLSLVSSTTSCPPKQTAPWTDVVGTVSGIDVVLNVDTGGMFFAYQLLGDLDWRKSPPKMEGDIYIVDIYGTVTGGGFDFTRISTLRTTGGPSPDAVSVGAVSAEELQSAALAAADLWNRTGNRDRNLHGLQLVVTDLPGTLVGAASSDTVYVDYNAAGYGWFVDRTPRINEEFVASSATSLRAANSSPATGRMDLLTVLTHELGHVLGWDDLEATEDQDNVMAGILEPGVRRVPWAAAVDAAFGGGV